MYDSHNHSTNSDGNHSVREMCLAAIEKGVRGIAMTDHADMNFYRERDTFRRVRRSLADTLAAKEEFADRLTVSRGVELGEYLYSPKDADEVLLGNVFDVVLCSVHYVPGAGWDRPYNRIRFSEEGSDEQLRRYLERYFQLLSETVDHFDFDVLAHISCPVRYMTGRYLRKTDVMEFRDMIEEILKKIIRRGIALEFNTGGIDPLYSNYDVQNEDVFRMYRALGGERITLGSDSHDVSEIARGFECAKAQLRSYGFSSYCFYENRTAKTIQL